MWRLKMIKVKKSRVKKTKKLIRVEIKRKIKIIIILKIKKE